MISDETARELLSELDERNPDAGRLARLAALAAHIEPEILRALRLHVLEGASVTAEADVWFSDLVQSRGVSSITFFDGALPTLRKECESDRERVVRACKEIARVHRTSNDLVKLEERLIVAALELDPDGRDWTETVDAHLSKVAAAILADQGRALDLSSWALRALPRLPARVRERSMFWTLLFLASAGRPEVAIDLPAPPATALANVFEDAFRNARRVSIEVLWQDGAAGLRIAPLDREGALQVPATRPVVVQAGANGRWTPLVLTRDRWTLAPVVGGEILIRSIDGAQFRIRSRASRADPHDHARSVACVMRMGIQLMGFLVAPSLIASVAHTAYKDVGEAVNIYISGHNYMGTVAWLEVELDVALLRIELSELDAHPLPLAPHSLPVGTRWTTYLNDGSENVVHAGGVIDGVTSEGYWILAPDEPNTIRPGSSGAPILVEGSVVGQLAEAQIPERRTLHAVPARAIAEALSRFEVRREPPSEANDWAIVVGVRNYSSVAVPYQRVAAGNAMGFAEWLTALTGGRIPKGQVSNLNTLLSPDGNANEPSLATIEQAFERLMRRALERTSESGPWGRRLYIYFAGTTTPTDNPSIPPALLPADASEPMLQAVSSEAYVNWFIESRAFAEIVVILDCVIADGVGVSSVSPIPRREIPARMPHQTRVYRLWTERSYPTQGGASLTSMVLAGLYGAAKNATGQITTDDLTNYLRSKLALVPNPPHFNSSSQGGPIVLVPNSSGITV